MWTRGKRQTVRAEWECLSQDNSQLCSSTSHIHGQKTSFPPALHSLLHFLTHLSVTLSVSHVTLCLASFFLSRSPLYPPFTFSLTSSQPLGRSVSLYLCLSPSRCMPLPFIHSPIICCFYHLFPHPIWQRRMEQQQKQTVRTAHNFASFDSD